MQKDNLTSRERVKLALSFQEPDRVPCNYFGTREITQRLMDHFGATDQQVLMARLGVDFRGVMSAYRGPGYKPATDGSYRDFWHILRKPVEVSGGHYEENAEFPLADATTMDEVEAWPWPDLDWFDCSSFPETCRANHDYCIVAGTPGNMDMINGLCQMRGHERALVDLATEDPIGMAALDKRFDFWYRWSRKCLEACGGEADILHIGDDYGTQRGLLLSPDMWRRLMAPRLRKMVDLAHEFGAKLMLHSCGSTRDLMEDFVATGVDILDTVQPYAAKMEPAELKASFGDRLVFHGMLSVQHVLPEMDADGVEAEVERICGTMKPGGGFALAPTHNIQPDTPVENVLRMYEAVREYGTYD